MLERGLFLHGFGNKAFCSDTLLCCSLQIISTAQIARIEFHFALPGLFYCVCQFKLGIFCFSEYFKHLLEQIALCFKEDNYNCVCTHTYIYGSEQNLYGQIGLLQLKVSILESLDLSCISRCNLV